MVKPSHNAALAEHVVAEVRQMIATGAVKPGERLPPERELSAQLGMNRPECAQAFTYLKQWATSSSVEPNLWS